MNTLAGRADVQIVTFHNFFPNKSAVILTLVQTTLDTLSDGLQQQFRDVTDIDDAAQRMGDTIINYCSCLREEPVISDILSSTQGDKKLKAMDQQYSIRQGKMLLDVFGPFASAA